jgi:hypothetical protein
MKEWMGADLSGLDIMVVQIDGKRCCDRTFPNDR